MSCLVPYPGIQTPISEMRGKCVTPVPPWPKRTFNTKYQLKECPKHTSTFRNGGHIETRGCQHLSGGHHNLTYPTESQKN